MSEPLRLYVDTFNKLLVPSENGGQPLKIGTLHYGTTYALRVYLLLPNPPAADVIGSDFRIISNTDLGLKVAVGSLSDEASTTPMASQNDWEKDANNEYFEGELSLATA